MNAWSSDVQSPYGYPFSMIDRIESFDADHGTLVGVKCLGRNEPLLQGHFPGFPIFPGVLLIECLVQASSCLLRLRTGNPAIRSVLCDSQIKHMHPVHPGDTIKLESRMVSADGDRATFRVSALVEGREVTRGRVALRPFAGHARGESGALPARG